MIKFLLNEYYKWSSVNIIHAIIAICVVVLANVVFAEPTIMTITSIFLVLTYFFTNVKSRFAYVLNIASTASMGFLMLHIGMVVTGYAYLAVLLPFTIMFALYIHINRIYPEDYEGRIRYGGFLSMRASWVIIALLLLLIGGGGYGATVLALSPYPLIDVSIITLFITSIVLVYFSKFEYSILYTVCDMLCLLLWVLIFLSQGIGISLIIITLIVFGRSRLLLVWWVAKTFRIERDENNKFKIRIK